MRVGPLEGNNARHSLGASRLEFENFVVHGTFQVVEDRISAYPGYGEGIPCQNDLARSGIEITAVGPILGDTDIRVTRCYFSAGAYFKTSSDIDRLIVQVYPETAGV